MDYAKLFSNGGSQAVRLPKDYRFSGDRVIAGKIGNIVILMPEDDPWQSMLCALDMFTDDFLKEDVPDLPIQERDCL